ncbi:MAG: hypothetical protein H0X29_01215 [Parachlamydiaceae bacterium]|nr:hypothetical protein [Parachlamydiaceae bacterium]
MNKIIIVFLLLACTIGQGLNAENLTQRKAIPDVVQYVLNCFAEEQESKELVLVEKISGYDEGQISKLGFLFDLYKPLTMGEARGLAIGLTNNLLEKVNNNEKLKNYLSNSPFTVNNVVMRIRLRQKDCGFIYPALGNIAYVSVIDGKIIYDTINSFTYDLDNLRTESFADAIKIPITSTSNAIFSL